MYAQDEQESIVNFFSYKQVHVPKNKIQNKENTLRKIEIEVVGNGVN